MPIKYTFGDDAVIPIKNAKKANPQTIGEALAKIADAHDGRLLPKTVVEAARNSRHALHKYFEWDDVKAAESYRLEQARELIRVIRVEEENAEADEEPKRAFYSIGDKGGVSYRATEEIEGSLHLSELLLRAADRDLEAFQKRHRALVDVCAIVQTAREVVAAKRAAKQESRVAA